MDDGVDDGTETNETNDRGNDYASGAEDVRVVFCGCRAATAHKYESNDYDNHSCCEQYEIRLVKS